MSLLKSFIVIVILGYAGIAAGMYLLQRQLMYFPENKGLTPEAAGLANVQALSIVTPDGENIAAWFAPPQNGQPVILYFHGNAGEIGDRPGRFEFYRQHGFGVLFVSYRGYGGSSGSPTEDGLATDAEAAYEWLSKTGIETKRIVLVGESLGTGVAVKLAAHKPVGAVALEAPYTSTTDIAADQYWWLPVRYLMKDRYESIVRIAAIKAPLLITHGDADNLIPIRYGRRLFEAALEPKSFIAWPGKGHDAMHEEETWKAEVEFFREHVG